MMPHAMTELTLAAEESLISFQITPIGAIPKSWVYQQFHQAAQKALRYA
jgi:hypothetical protein